jgi:putative transposase
MPRQPRLDAPGTLHHVMGRGIEGSEIFRIRKDQVDFLERFASLCKADSRKRGIRSAFVVGGGRP